MTFEHYAYTVLNRFLKYTVIDTQSDPKSGTSPSTSKQGELGRLLVQELHEMGISDALLDEYGCVYATLNENTQKNVPVICFCSHMDTSPDCSGTGVMPIIHYQYAGQDIILPDDPEQILSPKGHPDLYHQLGHDIITASGNTLLGADNKAGVAEIMDALHYLITHPEIKHGRIRILFTVDEEIGRGANHVNLDKLGASFGYTVDGEAAGNLEDETFCADQAIIQVHGVPVHTGFAKGKMVNALKIAARILNKLPGDRLSPESTSGRQGFIHPIRMEGNAEKAILEFLIRDFTEIGLKDHEMLLEHVLVSTLKDYPGGKGEIRFSIQYRNMKQVLDQFPLVTALALEAIRMTGLVPRRQSIRGGTDGSRLSYMGLPCPNIFAGEHAFHSRQEWISVQDMEKAVQTIVNLAVLWEQRS
ncbi:MAG TPA: peptidase T [Chitinophagaceae bacterium]|nr:peptidase T [Chitinophagaceae bacterium]